MARLHGHEPSAIDPFFYLCPHGQGQGFWLRHSLDYEGAECLLQSEKDHRTLNAMLRLLVFGAVRRGSWPFVFRCHMPVLDNANYLL